MYESLTTRHAGVALKHGEAVRYPPDVAPFLGVPRAMDLSAATLEALVPKGDHVFLLGPRVTPASGWTVEHLGQALQMVCEKPLPPLEGPEIVPLTTDEHHAQMRELTSLVYPHYFRPRTHVLGRYFGIFEKGRLAAMAGERMGMQTPRELSAICTHPDFLGRGLARRLLVWLSNDVFARGEKPFLHVDPENVRAVGLYERNGYVTRARLDFWRLS